MCGSCPEHTVAVINCYYITKWQCHLTLSLTAGGQSMTLTGVAVWNTVGTVAVYLYRGGRHLWANSFSFTCTLSVMRHECYAPCDADLPLSSSVKRDTFIGKIFSFHEHISVPERPTAITKHYFKTSSPYLFVTDLYFFHLTLSLPTPCYYISVLSFSAIFYYLHLPPLLVFFTFIHREVVLGTSFAGARVGCFIVFCCPGE
jgi:hypothetical protein